MERMQDRERVAVLGRRREDAMSAVLAGAGMVAFLAALALLFVLLGPT
jgi:hypothetical protein